MSIREKTMKELVENITTTELLHALDSQLHKTYWEWCEQSRQRREAKLRKEPTGDMEGDVAINHRIGILIDARQTLDKVTAQLRRLSLA